MLKIKSKSNLWFGDLKKKSIVMLVFILFILLSSIHYTKRLWIVCIQFMSSYFCQHSRTFEWKWNEKENFSRWLWRGQIFPSYSSFGFFLSNFNFNLNFDVKTNINFHDEKKGYTFMNFHFIGMCGHLVYFENENVNIALTGLFLHKTVVLGEKQ